MSFQHMINVKKLMRHCTFSILPPKFCVHFILRTLLFLVSICVLFFKANSVGYSEEKYIKIISILTCEGTLLPH